MDIDTRGVKRGRCIAEDCDCPLFERSENKLISTCNYCFCPPTKHRKIEVEIIHDLSETQECHENENAANATFVKEQESLMINEEEFAKSTSQLSKDMFELAVSPRSNEICIVGEDLKIYQVIIPPMPSFIGSHTGGGVCTQDNETRTPSQDETSDEQISQNSDTVSKQKKPFEKRIEKLLQEREESNAAKEVSIKNHWPKQWPRDAEKALREQKADSVTRDLIIRTVKNQLVANDLLSDEDFDAAAKLIVEKFRFFTSTINPDHKHVIALLRKCHSNSKSYYETKSLRKAKESANSSDVPENQGRQDFKALMEKELSKDRPSVVELKKLLDKCRATRLEELKNSQDSARMHLKKYLALKRSDMVIYEFEEMFEIMQTDLKGNWIKALSKLKAYFCIETALEGVDSLTVQAIKCICQKLCKKKKDHSRCMMEIHDESTSLSDVQPQAGEPPYLIGIGDVNKANLSFAVHVDGEPLYSGPATDALIFMYCCYWLFNLNYDSRSQLAFMFVETVLLKEKAISKISKKTSIVTLLTDSGII